MTTPSLQVYDSFENYASTLIHELAHATGHPKRLDRVLDGNMRSLEYATEELVAEFTDTYISAYLGIKKNLPNTKIIKRIVKAGIKELKIIRNYCVKHYRHPLVLRNICSSKQVFN
ncbi:zincin-like metallopeptidase domain-containing protein [Erysipelothrix sp. D19-032]